MRAGSRGHTRYRPAQHNRALPPIPREIVAVIDGLFSMGRYQRVIAVDDGCGVQVLGIRLLHDHLLPV